MEVVVVALLAGSVLAAVHHAEVVAHRVGEPFGSLVLAVAVTIIEVSLIVTLMAVGGPGTASLARDTVFAALMITCNGIVGLALVIGALRRGMAVYQSEGTTGPLATIATLATLCLVLPSFTTASPGPVFSATQLAFAAVASLVLYGLYVFVQTVRYRDYFLPPLLPSPPDAAPGGTDREAPNIDLAHGSARAPGPPAPHHPAYTPRYPRYPRYRHRRQRGGARAPTLRRHGRGEPRPAGGGAGWRGGAGEGGVTLHWRSRSGGAAHERPTVGRGAGGHRASAAACPGIGRASGTNGRGLS